MGIYATRKQ